MLVNKHFQKWSKVSVTDYDGTIYTKIYKGYTRKLSLDHVTATGHNIKVSVKENEVSTEKNSSRASIFATKASYISN